MTPFGAALFNAFTQATRRAYAGDYVATIHGQNYVIEVDADVDGSTANWSGACPPCEACGEELTHPWHDKRVTLATLPNGHGLIECEYCGHSHDVRPVR